MYNAKKEFVTVLEKTGIDSAVQWLLLDVGYQDWKYRGNNDLIAELVTKSARECLKKPWNLEFYNPLSKSAAINYFLEQVYARREKGDVTVNGSTALDTGFAAMRYIYTRIENPLETGEDLPTYARRIYDILTLYMVKMKNAVGFWCEEWDTDEEFKDSVKAAFNVLDALLYTWTPAEAMV